MATRKIKIKDGENITPSNIKKVISLLNSEKPITKKEACKILNITYNTTRLNKIIEDFIERENYVKERRKQMRSIPLSLDDKKTIISDYLIGTPISEISESTFRSNNVIKNVLKTYNIPFRDSEINYSNPLFVPDDAISENYERGDLVFSARYNTPAYIEKRYKKDDPMHGPIYRIRLVGPYRRQAIQPYYELADLTRLQKELNIQLTEMSDEEIQHEIALTLYNARKKRKND